MGKRRLGRETALQALYLCDISKLSSEEAFNAVIDGHEGLDTQSIDFSREIVSGASTHRADLDAAIQSTAKNWELGRMAAVDRALLRMAAYELTQHPETPINVILDEAIEIAKKFSDKDSPRFVNGILDKIKSLRKE
jgi:N utilization substance protein B